MIIEININKEGLNTSECEDLSDCLEFFDTDNIIGILEGNKHSFSIGQNKVKVTIKRKGVE